MLPQVLSNPPHLHIPKFIQDFPLSRPKIPSSDPFFVDISTIVSSSVSPVQSDSPATVDDDTPSPNSPPATSANYHYVSRPSASSEMYQNPSQTLSYPATPQSYHPVSNNYEIINTSGPGPIRSSDPARPYLSDSPSPVDTHSSSSFPHTLSSQQRLSQTFPSYNQSPDHRYNEPPSDAVPDRYPRTTLPDKYSNGNNSQAQNSLLDHRRMSEPAVLGSANVYADSGASNRLQQFNFNPPALNPPRSSGSAYVPSLQRGVSMSSLRDLRQYEYPPQSQPHYPGWKDDGNSHRPPYPDNYHSEDRFADQVSPLQSAFSGGLDSPTSGLQYPEDHYGPSPPGTGTSTSSAPLMSPPRGAHSLGMHMGLDITHSPRDPNSKTYSFVSLPGNAVKKRPRRRYDEIERLYQCSWPDCNKAYGTLNHLNAHVTMQKHGAKRSPNEFKELRKQWRKAKKDSELPVTGPLRRTTMPQRYDVHDAYSRHQLNANNYSSPSMYNRSSYHSSGAELPSSASVRHIISDDIHYPTNEKDNQFTPHPIGRQRFNGTWQSSRPPVHQYLSSSLPSQSHIHHNHPSSQPQPQPQPHRSQSPPHGTVNRLPPNSTLLTPLPGYQPPPMLPPLQSVDSGINYPSGNFEMYEDDGRPSTGHRSIGSVDDY